MEQKLNGYRIVPELTPAERWQERRLWLSMHWNIPYSSYKGFRLYMRENTVMMLGSWMDCVAKSKMATVYVQKRQYAKFDDYLTSTDEAKVMLACASELTAIAHQAIDEFLNDKKEL